MRGSAGAARPAIELPIYIIDAFAERSLTGNPAAVCPLENWLPDATMQAIAAEMNLSETAFFAPEPNGVPEDPVSGVAHLCLAPYWAQRLGKTILVGHQLSQRGGVVRCCELRGDRVRLGGSAAIFLSGQIRI